MKELNYEERLCLKLMSHAVSCRRLENMKMSEIKSAISFFFDDDTIKTVIEHMTQVGGSNK